MTPDTKPDPHRLRVLHAVPDLAFGGLQRVVVQLCGLIDPERFDSRVLVFGAVGPLAAPLIQAGRVERVGRLSRLSMLQPTDVIRIIRQLAPDVLHAHSGVWYKSSLAARRAGVPRVIYTDHGRMTPDPLSARLVDNLASRRTDVVVAVSEPLAEHLRQRVIADPRRVRVVPNGVDTDLLRPVGAGELRDSLALPPGPVIGSIGRLEPIKGFDVMVESFIRLRARYPQLGSPALVVVGDGATRDALEARVRQSGLTRAVRFLGWREDVSRILSLFDLFTLTSWSEGTSMSLLEAMSCGVCPVVTEVGGNRIVLGAELAHRLVRPGDPDAIAAGWAAALNDSARRAADGAAARSRVERWFSLRVMVRRYESIYLGAGLPDDALRDAHAVPGVRMSG